VRLDYFDQKILDVLSRNHKAITLNELVSICGFARSTVLIHLEHLGSEQLVLKEKKPKEGRGRPQFLYCAETPKPSAPPLTNVVVLNFSTLERACRYEKGGYCKPKGDNCRIENCPLIMKQK
jgi:predicted transcriptional regulator